MRRNLWQSIKYSLTRYIAIVAIIALGGGIFVGLRTTKSDMIATGQRYMDEQNMFDLRLLSTYGWNKSDVEKVAALEGIDEAEGSISVDVIAHFSGAETDSVYKIYSIPQHINKVYLHGGRMPQNDYECLADGFHASDDILGREITLSESNDSETLDGFREKTFTVVGYVSSPLYMDMSRGNTSLGNGSITGYLYVPESAFDLDYYTDIYVTLPGEKTVYTDAYHDHVQNNADRLEPYLLDASEDRFEQVLKDVKQAYQDGLQEYEKGLAEFNQGKLEAETELADAKKKLTDGEKEIADSKQQISDGLEQAKKGQETIDSNKKQLINARVLLSTTKAETYAQLAKASSELVENYKQVNSAIDQIDSGLLQIASGLTQIDSGISQLESGLQTLNTMIDLTNTMLELANYSLTRAENALEAAKKAGLSGNALKELEDAVSDSKEQIDQYYSQLADMKSQQAEYTKQLEDLRIQRGDLEQQKLELEKNKLSLEQAKKQIDQGFVELDAAQTQAENEFAAAEAKLQASELQLQNAQDELDRSVKKLEDGQKEIETAERELEDGWSEFYEAEEEVKRELEDGKIQLEDAKKELDDAATLIESMDGPEVYALGRTTNVGYLALDSNAAIVEGVSAVLPVFFLLIAALVCITTMTRMVEEERTQIGTLKALGYGNGAIIGKYLAYAGSAAVIGCGLGVVIGSIVFPLVLWEAYQILMHMGDYFILRMNWPLCILVVSVYTAVTMFVTWYCCRLSLREVAAELIRPKPPTIGRKIFLEKLPFWNKISFLNKVMIRNIFRYRQRLLMMLIGIGGCTALLLTGFGIRDSIGNLASFQFSEVILYDIEVRFDHALSQEEQADFVAELGNDYSQAFFYHQSSAELEFNDQVKDITFIASEKGLDQYIDFHSGDQKLAMPGEGEALISVGVSKMLGISLNDTILVRDADMRVLEVKVTGIFDNNVYNYVVVSPESVAQQWEKAPEVQMACVNASSNIDTNELGAMITDMDNVMSVTVNADVKKSVGKMLEALDLVVITVVICAALLAVIVLYNLTNINITERIREIATIKVLGFNAFESAAYVFKENLLLSGMGSLLGLGLGIFLLEFVMSQIKVDMVWMTARLAPMSYVWAMVITMLSACFVDFILYYKLDKINMAEALKSVE